MTIPTRFRDMVIESHPNAEAAEAVRLFLESRSWTPPNGGHGLVIVGPVGTGKTGMALGALGWLMRHCRGTVEYVGVPDMLERLRPPAGIEELDRYRQANVLVLDDLGAERITDWARERLYVLMNHRWEWCLPTIVTTNLGMDALADHVGDRIVSRLQDGATVVALGGEDLRRG